MVDEIVPAAPAVEATPVAPVVAPTVETTPTAPEIIPAVDPVKTDAPTEVKAEASVPDTLLAQDKKEEVKPTEVKAEVNVEENPVEVKTEEKVAELPKYEWKLPEGITVDDAKMGDFTKMLGDFEVTTKVPHEEMQALGQRMVERHLEEMQRYTKSLTDAWNKQANDWKESFLKSPEFANRTDTVLNSAIDVINTYGGTTEQQKEFRDLMESTKIGNHPAMIRLLSNIKLGKPEPKPLAAPTVSTPAKRSKIETMYGKKSA